MRKSLALSGMRTGRCAVQRYPSVDEADERSLPRRHQGLVLLSVSETVGDSDAGNARREQRLVCDAVDLRSLTKTPGDSGAATRDSRRAVVSTGAFSGTFASGAFGIVRVGYFQHGARQLGLHYHIGRYWDIYDPGSPAIAFFRRASNKS
jgi:hypothetical protein